MLVFFLSFSWFILFFNFIPYCFYLILFLYHIWFPFFWFFFCFIFLIYFISQFHPSCFISFNFYTRFSPYFFYCYCFYLRWSTIFLHDIFWFTFFMETQSHDSDHRLRWLAWFDSLFGFFLELFFFQFHPSMVIKPSTSWIVFLFLWDYFNLISHDAVNRIKSGWLGYFHEFS
jgi:hypothetical protein